MPVEALEQKRKVWTDEELEALPRDGHKRELLDGKLIRRVGKRGSARAE
ncbi:MAG: hypothetical protein ABSG59_02895 [Verrucomicrobiota bacterium]|jgi:hypothetical protein